MPPRCVLVGVSRAGCHRCAVGLAEGTATCDPTAATKCEGLAKSVDQIIGIYRNF